VDSAWRKSSHSSGNGDNCVEVATVSAVLVRDTAQAGEGPVLSVSGAAWTRFLRSLDK
jgi:hypothetical protein